MNKNIILIVLALAVVALIAYFWTSSPAPEAAPTADGLNLEQANAAADQDIQGTDVASVDAEFQAVDKDLSGL